MIRLSIVVVAACLIPLPCRAQEEPVLRNKKASEWANLLRGEEDFKNQRVAQLVLGNAGARPGLFKQAALVRRSGLIALQIIGAEKYPAALTVVLTTLQNDPEEEIRAAAASALGSMYEKVEKGRFAQAREALSIALRRDPSPRVREAAASALGRQEPEDARSSVAVLAKALEDPDADVCASAADTLRRLGKDAAEALPELIALLGNPKARTLTRTQAALALGRIGPPEAVEKLALPALGKALEDPATPTELRSAIVESIGFFGKDAAPLVPGVAFWLGQNVPVELRRKVATTLDQLGADSRPAFKQMLAAMKDEDKYVRALIVHTLAGIGRDLTAEERGSIVVGFLNGMGDSSSDVRIASIDACAKLGMEGLGDAYKPVVDRLGLLSRDTRKDVAEAAKAALSKLKPT